MELIDLDVDNGNWDTHDAYGNKIEDSQLEDIWREENDFLFRGSYADFRADFQARYNIEVDMLKELNVKIQLIAVH